MRGGNPAETAASEAWNPSDFGVSGRLINWDFDSLGDALGMYPEDLIFAYWINMTASENLTEAAASVLPPAVGLTYRYQVSLYPSPIDRVSWGLYNDEMAEFHWTKPAPVGSHGLAVLYDGYQIIPFGTTDLYSVLGMPVLFGSESSIKTVLDVITGEAPTTEKFVLPYDEIDALQISILGKDAATNPSFTPPLDGEYAESYLGISPTDEGYLLTAKYLSLHDESERRVKDVAESHGLSISSDGDITTVSGTVLPENLTETLGAFITP